jgi:hypothetical protein
MGSLQIFIDPLPNPIGIFYLILKSVYIMFICQQTCVNVNTSAVKRKLLPKYLMNTIDLNEHDVDIFINGKWQKYTDSIGNKSFQDFPMFEKDLDVCVFAI